MSGRTFTYQGNFDDFVRTLLPDVELSERRRSVGIADSMLREIEEFMNRFVVTATNDAGDITFDAAGTYTFQGNVVIAGELTAGTDAWHVDANGNMWWGTASAYTGADNYITAAGVLRFGESGGTYLQTFTGTNRFGLEFFPSNSTDFPYEGEFAMYGANVGSANESWRFGMGSPQGAAPNTDTAQMDLKSQAKDGTTAEATLYVSSGSLAGLQVTDSNTKLNSHGSIDITTGVTAGYVYIRNGTGSRIEIDALDSLELNSTGDVTCDITGNFGIDELSPGAKLHVNSGATNNVATFESTDASALISLVDSTTTASSYVGLQADGDDLSLRAGNSNQVRVQSDGDVGIGTTSPGQRLHVNSGNANTTSVFESNDGTAYIGIKDNASGSNIHVALGAVGNEMRLRANNTNIARVTSTGLHPNATGTYDLGESGRVWDTLWLDQGAAFSSGGYWTLRSRDSDRQVMEFTSSERWKKDVTNLPVEEAYKILEATPILFHGEDDDPDSHLEAGMSAERLHASGYDYAVRYDEGHWGQTPRAVYYEMLAVPLITICKHQEDRIVELERQIQQVINRK